MGLTLRGLAERVGCTASYLSMVEREHHARVPSDALLGKLEHVLGLTEGSLVVAAHWASAPAVLRRMIDQAQRRRHAHEHAVDGLAPDCPEHDARGEVHVPVLASVGSGQHGRDGNGHGHAAREYLRLPGVTDPDAFAARIAGDAMEPVYLDGDLVVFSPGKPVESGCDCYVRFEDEREPRISRVYFEPTGSGGVPATGAPEVHRDVVRLQPLNPRHPPLVVARAEIALLVAAVSVTRLIR